MLDSITLKFTENDDLTLPATGITVFVGPNNSGKSLLLRELEQALSSNPFPAGLSLLRDYQVNWPSIEDVKFSIAKMSAVKVANRQSSLPPGHVIVGRINPNGGLETTILDEGTLVSELTNKANKGWLASQYLRWGLVRLDGRSRFNLTNDQAAGDLLGPPNNALAHLFQNDVAREKVRALVSDAFQVYFVIDPTNLGSFRIRLSREPALGDEQSLNEVARAFHKAAVHIKDASDGVQAFSGIVTAVMSGEFHTILVDEPEAFLHPPLARKLGKHLATLATERGGSLMASTHSPDFLMGCVQATKDVRVVRLEFADGKSRGKMVDPEQLETLFRRPLMRSSNVVSALFYDGVVVTESDNDRAFYSEVYHRLAEEAGNFPSVLFINAQNKQTMRHIVGPLRQFGVPAVGVPDIDIVKDGGATWTEWLQSARVPEALHLGYGSQRAAIKTRLEATGKNMKTDGGTNLLEKDDKLAAEHFFDHLEEYGIFAVRHGEVEDWLSTLGVPGKKTDWTIAMLERMGSDPSDPSYVKPGDKDVWDFMRRIVAWIHDPARRGTS